MIDGERRDPDVEVTAFLVPARRDIAELGYHLT
jgi:hypothetical protein